MLTLERATREFRVAEDIVDAMMTDMVHRPEFSMRVVIEGAPCHRAAIAIVRKDVIEDEGVALGVLEPSRGAIEGFGREDVPVALSNEDGFAFRRL